MHFWMSSFSADPSGQMGMGMGQRAPHKGGHRLPNDPSNADSADALVSPAAPLAIVGVFEHWRWGGCTQRARIMP